MMLKRPTDKELKRVLFDDEIWERETDDLSPTRENMPMLPYNVSVVGGYLNGEIIGIALTHRTEVGLKFHFAVLRARRKHARRFLELACEWIGEKVYCEIPDCYRSVINFAKHAGFIESGKNGTYIKNGVSYQRTRLCQS